MADIFGHEWWSVCNDEVSSLRTELFSFSFLSMSVQNLDVQVTAVCHIYSIHMNNMYLFFICKKFELYESITCVFFSPI